MDCSTSGFPVLHYLLEFVQTHVQTVIPFFSCLQSFPASGSFPMSQFFASGGQSIGISASVLPVNIQDWFPLGWTGWISLQSKELSRVFFSTAVWILALRELLDDCSCCEGSHLAGPGQSLLQLCREGAWEGETPVSSCPSFQSASRSSLGWTQC